MDVTEYAEFPLFEYRCGCNEGYRRNLDNLTWCDSVDMTFDLISLVDDEGTFGITLGNGCILDVIIEFPSEILNHEKARSIDSSQSTTRKFS